MLYIIIYYVKSAVNDDNLITITIEGNQRGVHSLNFASLTICVFIYNILCINEWINV